jgi:hypothetical protein
MKMLTLAAVTHSHNTMQSNREVERGRGKAKGGSERQREKGGSERQREKGGSGRRREAERGKER